MQQPVGLRRRSFIDTVYCILLLSDQESRFGLSNTAHARPKRVSLSNSGQQRGRHHNMWLTVVGVTVQNSFFNSGHLMTFKKRTDAVSRSYWEFVERTAREVQHEMPAWARKDTTTSATTARSAKTRTDSATTRKGRAKADG